jgi:1,5-anhydro-D-fructose reductase (1,5-anhydro-D-mannitol-forming)
VYKDNICLHGVWSFSASRDSEQEKCEIIGDRGKLTFSFFQKSEIAVKANGVEERINLKYPVNIQQPMIDEVVKFFRGEGGNPCSLEDALVTMEMMDHSNTLFDGKAF